MTKLTIWDPNVGDRPANLALTNNFAATTNPTVNDDTSLGYTPGSVWVNVTGQTSWVCVSNADGAAVWVQSSSSGEQNAQFTAPAAAGATDAGGQAKLTGGAGGATSGAGGASTITGGAGTAGNSAGGAAQAVGGAGQGSAAGGASQVTGGVGGATGAGGKAQVTGGAGGATSGAGGAAEITGGAGSAGNANGGSVVIAGGAANGSGINGMVFERSIVLRQQAAQATQDTAATLTVAQILNGIIQSTPGGAINLTLPTQANMDAAVPDAATNDSFDFSIINTSGGANTITILANSWTTVGVLTIAQNVSGRFRARKTGVGAWTLYRLS